MEGLVRILSIFVFSPGDLAETELNLTLILVTDKFARFAWTAKNLNDERRLLGWMIYYREVWVAVFVHTFSFRSYIVPGFDKRLTLLQPVYHRQ